MRAPTCLHVPCFTRAEYRGRGRRRDHGATTGRTVHIHSLTTPDAALAGRSQQFIPRRRTVSGFGGWLPRMIITMSGRAGQMLEKSSVLGGTRDTHSSRFEKRGCLNWFAVCRGPPHLHRQPLCSCRNADDVGADLLSVSPRMGPGMRAPRSQPPDYSGPGRPSLAAPRASLRYRWPSQFLISFPLQWVSMISVDFSKRSAQYLF